MIIKTKGIVFQSIKYGDSSLVVKIFTEELGLQSYMVKGVRSRKSRMKPSFFEPLTLLDMEVYNRPHQNLHHIKEIGVDYAWQHIPFSIEKQSVLLFLNEVLYKCIREEQRDKEFFSWIYHSLVWFDLEENQVVNFHLFFLVQLTRFLGFYPKATSLPEQQVRFFDMQDGSFTVHRPLHSFFAEGVAARKLFLLTQATTGTLKSISFTGKERRLVLDSLMVFYQLHLPELGKIKSLDVLRMVMGSAAPSAPTERLS